MARQASNFDWDDHPTGRTQYPWNKWLDPDNNTTWLLVAGEDFTCEVTSIKSLISSTAKKRGVDVMVADFEEDGDTIVALKVTGVLDTEESEEEAPKADDSDGTKSVFAQSA